MSVAMAAEDLRALAWLHEMERAPAVLAELHRSGFPQTLSLLPPTHDAVTQMAATLAAIADTTQENQLHQAQYPVYQFRKFLELFDGKVRNEPITSQNIQLSEQEIENGKK